MRGVIYGRGKDLFTFFSIFTCRPTLVRHGGLGVGSGSFFVVVRGRVRVGDSIRGLIYHRGKDI